MVKPFDTRLLQYAKSTRGVLLLGGLLGILRTIAIIVWCWCASQALAVLLLPVLGGERFGIVLDSAPDSDTLPWLITGALAAVIGRSLATWMMDMTAARGAIAAKAEIRSAALETLDSSYVDDLEHSADSVPSTTLGRGLDALDGYYAQYVPQLILTVCATPLLILTVLLVDWPSAVVVIVVFPVIPIFMVLIGLATQSVQKKQWTQLQYLSSSFLDVVSGLTTLKIFRREHRQEQRIQRESEEYRSRTMKLLRVTFLSGFVLDLAGTFSIALVAVAVGTRLIDGRFSLALGLFVLLLLPEVFMPIRQVGVAFHASTEGLEASQAAFDLIENERVSRPGRATNGRGSIQLRNTVVQRGEHTTIGPVSFEARTGEITVLTGPSGSGKSSLIAAIMGFTGKVTGHLDRPEVVSWCGQAAGLLQGSIADNISLGDTAADRELVAQALESLSLAYLPLDRHLGALGTGLSGGQAQRTAIARCLYRAWTHNARAIVLDEPTSALDETSEQAVIRALRAEADHGRAVLVVSHRPAVIAAADQRVEIGAHV
ncbi:MAG: thiol reductant ABC exporter subunit CydD [Canibacter sp.]